MGVPVQTQSGQADTGQASDGFSFAQISDPHLTSLADIRFADLLNKRLLGYLSWRKRRRREHQRGVLDALIRDLRQAAPDHLVITGDLTHIGLPGEFREARAWLKSVARPSDLTLIPGNHEAYAKSDWKQTCALWQEYMRSDDGTGNPETLFPSLRVRGPTAIIGLSSSLPTPPFLATGRVGNRQLQTLGPLLEKTGRQGLFRILLVHHSPAAGVHKWRKRLTDRSALAEVLQHQGAELVLHGHSHRSTWSELPGPEGSIPVIGTPSGSAAGSGEARRARYHLYRLKAADQNWRLQVEVRGYSSEDLLFHHEEACHLEIPRSSPALDA